MQQRRSDTSAGGRRWARAALVVLTIVAAVVGPIRTARAEADTASGACTCLDLPDAEANLVFEGRVKRGSGGRYMFHVDAVGTGLVSDPHPVVIGSCGPRPSPFTRYRVRATSIEGGVADAGYCGSLTALGRTFPDPRAVADLPAADVVFEIAAVLVVVAAARRIWLRSKRDSARRHVTDRSPYLSG